MSNLVRQFPYVTQYQAACAVLRDNLLKNRKDKDGSFAHARIGLANDVSAKNGLGNDLELHLRRVLKTAVYNSTQQLRFKEEILERRGVDSRVGVLRTVGKKGQCRKLITTKLECPQAAKEQKKKMFI